MSRRAAAVAAAETAADSWDKAVRMQRRATADHADFYALARDMVATLHALDDLTRVLDAQVTRYMQRDDLYDDTRTVDPVQRLHEAADELADLRVALHDALGPANRFWSAIGHIGVEAGR